MFICKKCWVDEVKGSCCDWEFRFYALSSSRGECEFCNKRSDCIDIHHSKLPEKEKIMEKEDYKFENYESFFKWVGDKYLYPTSYGEKIFDFSVEELYQHIKARLKAEKEG